jgi:hypothetical protein
LNRTSSWYLDPRVWLEAFIAINLAFLALDIYLAHSVNDFRVDAEYLPLWFSLVSPVLLVGGFVASQALTTTVPWRRYLWRDLGFLVGWVAIAMGLAGVFYHLNSHFFHDRTIKSLVYAAPFAAPLAYTGLGLLLLMNRLVDQHSGEWPRWVVLLGLGGFVGNFIFSLADHAQNGFYHWTEWIPVVSSALGIGFLTVLFFMPVTQRFLVWCGAMLVIQVVVGLLGFYLHNLANWHGTAGSTFRNFVDGAPALAPMLFPNLALLCGIGLWVWRLHCVTEVASEPATEPDPSVGSPLPASMDLSEGGHHS